MKQFISQFIKREPEKTDYDTPHKPDDQPSINGIIMNPNLRPDFDCTDLNDRDSDEVRDWWRRPFIVTIHWQDIHRKVEQEITTLKKYCPYYYLNLSTKIISQKQSDWFTLFPSGTCYEVRCLDGQQPDRSSIWGCRATLKCAIELAKKGPGSIPSGL